MALTAEPTLADRIAAELAQRVRAGAYPVASRLPTEVALAAHYGVSRTVIREVIARLKSQGLVDSRQGSGTVVLDARSSDAFRVLAATRDDPALGVLRILELRRGVEAEMAALAAQRRSAADVKAIARALQAIDDAVQRGGDGVAEDLAFHLAIASASRNPLYSDLLGLLTRALHDAIHVTRRNEARRADLAAQVRAEHQALCEAIRVRDPVAARVAAYGHLLNTAARLRKAGRAFWAGSPREAADRVAATRLRGVARPTYDQYTKRRAG
ncbi:FadR/GntR family transcriptional regulator [Ideonella sp. A 288]|uniref:FadR/GntR family transcriptional regulator n=1 Tax=Ideonella sp. A 288 TaxID=1962181 RepID=UPI000B4BFB17|nr:FadR/GntR family transcriptional regulator [Ideonella sp. A 288]